MNGELRSEVYARARGKCECGCGASVAVYGEFDHFFGRAKAEESATTVWLLTSACHYAKTRNSPSSAQWLLKFIAHCGRHSYAQTAARAQMKLEWQAAMGARA